MKIVLYNQKEIELTSEEAELVKQKLADKGTQFVEIGEQLINVKDIRGIFESEGIIPNFKKLPEPKEEEKRIRVPGGWQKVSAREKIIELFNKLKKQGCFSGYSDYFAWEKEKYNSPCG